MATDELLPPACAFAISVLAEFEQDPDAVPEEAVEAAQQHIGTCVRCLSANVGGTPRKKKKVRRVADLDYTSPAISQVSVEEIAPQPQRPAVQESAQAFQTIPQNPIVVAQSATQLPAVLSKPAAPPPVTPVPTPPPASPQPIALIDGPLDCQQCRQLLPEYAEALDNGQNVALLFPEVQEHFLTCETGCLVLLELFRQEAKANRKYRRRPVRNPFGVMYWEVTGFFRRGNVPIAPMALSYGTLILLLLFASLSIYLTIKWDDARYYRPPVVPKATLPTPDGIGLSDGLKIYDACNTSSYNGKRQAAQAIQQGNFSKADTLLQAATTAPLTDTTGCNGAEAAIYRADLQVRQSGRPYGLVIVSFDSGPGNADPQGGTDRHILYAAYTQELIGAYIAQQSYNDAQMQTSGAPLLYLVLANTTGTQEGALQTANNVASIASGTNLSNFGLLATNTHPLVGVLGLGPSSLVQVVLPVLCRAGVPLIVPTAPGLFIIDLIAETSLYRHCTPGFAFIRFSPDDSSQSLLAASYAYNQLHIRNAAIFYDPSNPSSKGSAQFFSSSFSGNANTQIVAQETAVASGLLDANGRPQASREDLLASLQDALKANPRPELIFAPLLTNDVITIAQEIAKLPIKQQPVLMIGGEFVQPSALQGLVQWARQQQLTLPHIYISQSAAARQPTDDEWQKAFYAKFCTLFATPGSYCSGAAALDEGALFFADSIHIFAKALGPITDASQFPSSASIIQRIATLNFAGVSCPISLVLNKNVLITSNKAAPVILVIQGDGTIQIVG